MKGVEKEIIVKDFTNIGEDKRLVWQEPLQNFVIAPLNSQEDLPPKNRKSSSVEGFLENPSHGLFQSGIGILSGWVCDSNEVTLEINGKVKEVSYGTSRSDTIDVCGDENNGFGLLFNWNHLGDGVHTAKLLIDKVELGNI